MKSMVIKVTLIIVPWQPFSLKWSVNSLMYSRIIYESPLATLFNQVRNSPTHGGFTSHWQEVYISKAMQGGRVYYKTFMEQKLMRMSLCMGPQSNYLNFVTADYYQRKSQVAVSSQPFSGCGYISQVHLRGRCIGDPGSIGYGLQLQVLQPVGIFADYTVLEEGIAHVSNCTQNPLTIDVSSLNLNFSEGNVLGAYVPGEEEEQAVIEMGYYNEVLASGQQYYLKTEDDLPVKNTFINFHSFFDRHRERLQISVEVTRCGCTMASPIGSSTTESIDATIVSQGTVSRASVYSSQEDLKTTVYSTSLHQTSSQTFASSLPSSSPIIVLVSIDQGASNNPLNFPVVIVLAVVGTIVALCLITVTVITALLLAKARRRSRTGGKKSASPQNRVPAISFSIDPAEEASPYLVPLDNKVMSIGLEERASGIKIGDFLLNSNAFEIGRSLSEQTISTSDLDQPEVNHVYETTMERFPTDSPYEAVPNMDITYRPVPTMSERNIQTFPENLYWELETVSSAYESQEDNEYNQLESVIYWAPSATESEIYSQMSQWKFLEIPRQIITISSKLGEGQFGEVFKASWQSTKGLIECAVKQVRKGSPSNERVKLLQEAATLGQFKHRHVIRLFGVVTVGEPVLMVMEYLSEGDLLTHLTIISKNIAQLGDPHLDSMLLQFCKQVADGLAFLSQKSFVHRDIAARNVLLDSEFNCKISDFGMTRDLEEENYYVVKQGTKIPVKWTAPEAILYKKYSTASDVWSYGMLMYEIWSLGQKPFEYLTIDEFLSKLGKGYCQSPPPGCPRAVYSIMVQCWNPIQNERPTAVDILGDFCKSERTLLAWSEEDKQVSAEADVLGAPLIEGSELYMDLQTFYQS